MQDISNYEKLREDANNFYKKTPASRCPALNNEFVHFTAEGFNHLKHFWSVIPAWSTNHYRDIKIISMAKGDLACD